MTIVNVGLSKYIPPQERRNSRRKNKWKNLQNVKVDAPWRQGGETFRVALRKALPEQYRDWRIEGYALVSES